MSDPIGAAAAAQQAAYEAGLLARYSETNLVNSLAQYLAGCLLGAGYLVYWPAADAAQTPDGWYPNYRALAQTYAADPLHAAFQARLAAARGILTLTDDSPANPVYPARQSIDGSMPLAPQLAEAVGSTSVLGLPELAVVVTHPPAGSFEGLGSRRQQRFASVLVVGYARDLAEARWLSHRLRGWFDRSTVLAIVDHDSAPAGGGTPAPVGPVEVLAATAEHLAVPTGPEATTYEVLLTARVGFVA